mgnify:CR=1 FL=1|tara:strand:- start:2449 stop:3426 length:978 start_codon:yes stop_codon:yes gene_type:complete
MEFIHRPRRLRRTESIRSLVRETWLHPSDFILPLFVVEGKNQRQPIETMPGQYRFSVDEVVRECIQIYDLGIPAVNLFGYSSKKDDLATQAFAPNGLIPKAIKAIKQEVPGLSIQTDIALDPYTEHGHDGLLINEEVVNDETIAVLCKMAISHAEAGVDWVAPSDMMDGRIGAIRQSLDSNGFQNVNILSYSAKYASGFYGPFRGALNSTPKSGDKKTYQMDPANVREALREVSLDIDEGADVVMVKPALAYLDVISTVRQTFEIPVAAYNVSGEYGMLIAAADRGWLNREQAVLETLTAIKRAGADIILSYFAKEVVGYLRAGS